MHISAVKIPRNVSASEIDGFLGAGIYSASE